MDQQETYIVEGEDLALLKIFQDKIFPESNEPLDVLPNFPIGGWGGWNYVVGSSMMLKDRGGQDIAQYCILDRDYHLTEEIDKRYREAARHAIRLHIWNRKEIENYVVVPSALVRYINANKRKGRRVTEEEIEGVLDSVCENLKDETLDLISEEFIRQKRPKNAASSGNSYARQELRTRWTSLSGKLGVVSGKKLMSEMSRWAQTNHGIGLSTYSLARSMVAGDLDPELVAVLSAIEAGASFRRRDQAS
jgi:hypothetical protein